MKNLSGIVRCALPAMCLGLAGCASFSSDAAPEIRAAYVEKGPVLDGLLNDDVWKKAPVYETGLSRQTLSKSRPEIRNFYRNGITDKGYFRLLRDDRFLYIGVEFYDKDLEAEGLSDQLKHETMGDAAVICLKPDNDPGFWTICVTPRNYRSVSLFPGRGLQGLPSVLPENIPLKNLRTAARFDGTLNSAFDQDVKWTAEIAIPLDELQVMGIRLTPESRWKILLARRNYSRYLPQTESSTVPQLDRNDFSSYEEYGRLILDK